MSHTPTRGSQAPSNQRTVRSIRKGFRSTFDHKYRRTTMTRTPTKGPRGSPKRWTIRSIADDIASLITPSAAANVNMDVDREPPTLLTIPQELRDLIFDIAYSRQEHSRQARATVKFTDLSKFGWGLQEDRAATKSGSTYVPNQPPQPKVNEWLVSKAFFLEAARAWTADQVFSSRDVLGGLFGPPGGLKVLIPFVSEVIMALLEFKLLIVNEQCTLPGLKRIRLRITEHNFENLKPFFPWEEDIDDCEIYQIVHELNIDSLDGILDVSLEDCPNFRIPDQPGAKEIWERNVQRLMTVVTDIVTRHRGVAFVTPTEIEEKHASCQRRCELRPNDNPKLAALYNELEPRYTFSKPREPPTPARPLYPGSKVSYPGT